MSAVGFVIQARRQTLTHVCMLHRSWSLCMLITVLNENTNQHQLFLQHFPSRNLVNTSHAWYRCRNWFNHRGLRWQAIIIIAMEDCVQEHDRPKSVSVLFVAAYFPWWLFPARWCQQRTTPARHQQSRNKAHTYKVCVTIWSIDKQSKCETHANTYHAPRQNTDMHLPTLESAKYAQRKILCLMHQKSSPVFL